MEVAFLFGMLFVWGAVNDEGAQGALGLFFAFLSRLSIFFLSGLTFSAILYFCLRSVGQDELALVIIVPIVFLIALVSGLIGWLGPMCYALLR